MYRVYPAKVLYIVSRELVDALVYLGPTLTDIKRFKIKGMPDIPHKHYKQVKRVVSDLLHDKKVLIKVNTSTKGSLYEVWDAEFYAQPLNLDQYDPCTTGLQDIDNLSSKILDNITGFING